MSCGHVPSRSYRHATGRISLSAKSCASSRSAFCSSVRVKSITVLLGARCLRFPIDWSVNHPTRTLPNARADNPEWRPAAGSGTKRTAMPAPRRFDLEDILNRPGTYFNPETEVLLVIDDAPELDQDLFEEGAEGGDWVLLGDDVPLDERARDEVIERFEVRHHPGATSAPAEDDEEELEEELEPDEEQPEL